MDMLFIILLLLTLFMLLIFGVLGLVRKVWKSRFSPSVKTVLILLLLIFPVVAYLTKDQVGSENGIGIAQILMVVATILIALNWSINLYRKYLNKGRQVNEFIFVPLLTIILSAIIMSCILVLNVLTDK